ncbi:MAG TPA: Maf family protein [Myxococcota bacterium]|nr:Maf family protein [Myxococcota bacterium]
MPTLPLVLASGSPRRRQLLGEAGVAIEIVTPRVDESAAPGEAPEALAVRLARDKALEVARRLGPEPERTVLGADTIVVVDGCVLGKPDDAAHAVRLLERITGREHVVITGVAVASSATLAARSAAVRSTVTMHPASRAEIEAYVATGESLDKAGAYAVQGEGRRFVAKVEGSETNVIGLPVEETLALLREAGVGAP